MLFVSLLSDGFTTMVVINPPEWKLANHTSVQWNRHKESVKETILCTSDPNNKVKEI